MSRSRYKVHEQAEPHFLTATIVNWLPLFGQRRYAQIVLESMAFLAEQKRWTIYAYVLMGNHLHWIAESPELSREVQSFKSYTARSIIDAMRQRKARWALRQLERFRHTSRKDQKRQL